MSIPGVPHTFFSSSAQLRSCNTQGGITHESPVRYNPEFKKEEVAHRSALRA